MNHPDELDINESAGRLFNDPTIKEQPEIPFCGCLSVRYYQPFFDVDTTDVLNRIGSAVFFCNRDQNFLSLIGDKPDAYGPFWVTIILPFRISQFIIPFHRSDRHNLSLHCSCFITYKQLV